MEGVDGDFGYSLGNLSKEDFKIFHSTVTEQYKEVMLAYKADFSEKFSIADYHKSEVATAVLHEKLWPKVARILSQQRLDQIKKT